MVDTTFVVLADPQLDGTSTRIKDLSALNRALNALGTGAFAQWPGLQDTSCAGIPMKKPVATFFAGDLCATGGEKDTTEQSNISSRNPANYQGGGQLRDLRSLYDPWHEDRKGIVGLNQCGTLYFGLGNHDIMDTGPGSGWRYFNNRYSGVSDFYRYQMWDFIAQMHTGFLDHKRGPRFAIPPEKIDSVKNGSYDWKSHSFNYVVNLEAVDIYQLHRYGGDSTHGRESGLGWLKHQLALNGYQRPVIIVQHFMFSDYYEIDKGDASSEIWNQAQVNNLMEILLPYNVVAVCVGHKHSPVGDLPVWVPGTPWPNDRNTMPQSFKKELVIMKKNAVINYSTKLAEIRRGSAFHKWFTLFRVEGANSTKNATTVDILYGTAMNSDSDSVNIDWPDSCSLSIPIPLKVYVRDIEIVFMDEKSENSPLLPTLCTELTCQSADINCGFGGRFTYIRPLLTTDANGAITSIHAWHSTGKELKRPNLAEGCSGDYRYVKTIQNFAMDAPITGLFLLRSQTPQKIQDHPGYSGMSEDINAGRGKSSLYLIWRTWTGLRP